MVPHGGRCCSPPRRLHPDHGSFEGHHHLRRREQLVGGGRGRASSPSGCASRGRRGVRVLSPLHHDAEFASDTRFGRLIVSGTHTSTLPLGLAASHFAMRGTVVGVGFSVAFERSAMRTSTPRSNFNAKGATRLLERRQFSNGSLFIMPKRASRRPKMKG